MYERKDWIELCEDRGNAEASFGQWYAYLSPQKMEAVRAIHAIDELRLPEDVSYKRNHAMEVVDIVKIVIERNQHTGSVPMNFVSVLLDPRHIRVDNVL